MIFESENDYESGHTEIFYNKDYLGFQLPDRHFILNENFNDIMDVKEYAFGNKAYIELIIKDDSNIDLSKLRVNYGAPDIDNDGVWIKGMRLSEMKTIADLSINQLWS